MTDRSQKTGDFVAHFFYSHSNKSQIRAEHLFRSYIKQIIGFLDTIGKSCPRGVVGFVKRFYGPKQPHPPSFGEVIDKVFVPLCEFLTELLPSVTYIVDGLDECEMGEERKVLSTFQKIVSHHAPPRIFISGREGLNVPNFIQGSATIRVSNEDSKGDIYRFIEWRINEKMQERQLTEDENVLQDVKSKLNERADRMLVQYP